MSDSSISKSSKSDSSMSDAGKSDFSESTSSKSISSMSDSTKSTTSKSKSHKSNSSNSNSSTSNSMLRLSITKTGPASQHSNPKAQPKPRKKFQRVPGPGHYLPKLKAICSEQHTRDAAEAAAHSQTTQACTNHWKTFNHPSASKQVETSDNESSDTDTENPWKRNVLEVKHIKFNDRSRSP